MLILKKLYEKNKPSVFMRNLLPGPFQGGRLLLFFQHTGYVHFAILGAIKKQIPLSMCLHLRYIPTFLSLLSLRLAGALPFLWSYWLYIWLKEGSFPLRLNLSSNTCWMLGWKWLSIALPPYQPLVPGQYPERQHTCGKGQVGPPPYT